MTVYDYVADTIRDERDIAALSDKIRILCNRMQERRARYGAAMARLTRGPIDFGVDRVAYVVTFDPDGEVIAQRLDDINMDTSLDVRPPVAEAVCDTPYVSDLGRICRVPEGPASLDQYADSDPAELITVEAGA